MTRIADLAASNTVIARILETQKRLHDLEIQVSTEKKSQTYQGIARSSQQLVNYENARDKLESFVATNQTMDMRVQTTVTVVDGIKTTLTEFRDALFDYEAGSLDNEQRVKDIQDAAFRALTDLSVHLNAEVDGRFIFAGGRVTTQPVDFGLTNLSDFQSQFDGEAVVYPPTREAHVETQLTTDTATTGNLTFTNNVAPTADTITAANAGTLAGIAVGSKFTVSGSGTHDGTYTVVSNNGTTIEISGTMAAPLDAITVDNDFTTADETVAATISVSNYYSGDTTTQTHRVSDNRDFTIDLNGIDPAFEKAIRAMGIIAQGAFGTNGGLDQHPERLDQAIYLVTSALELTPTGTPPFGAENTSNIRQIEQDLGYQQVLISQTNEQHEDLIAFFDQRVIDSENVDSLEVISRLLDESNALEAAYQAISRLQKLSLTNFL